MFGNAATLANNGTWGKTDIQAVQALNDELEKGAGLGQAWMNSMSGATKEAKQFVLEGRKNGQTFAEIAAGMQSTSASAKAASIAVGALNTVLTSIAIGALVAGLSLLVQKLDDIYHQAERTTESANKLRDAFEDAKKTADDNLNTFNKLAPRLQELSKGVDDLGNNVSLTDEEYAEFRDISQTIADMSPELVEGYGKQGEAIIQLKDNVVELRKNYEEAKKAAYDLMIVGTGDKNSGNVKTLMQEYKNVFEEGVFKGLGGSKLGVEEAQYIAEIVREYYGTDQFESQLETFRQKAQVDSASLGHYLMNVLNLETEFYNPDKWKIQDVEETKALANSYIKAYTAERENALNTFKDVFNAFLLQSSSDFYDLSEDAQSLTSLIINNIDEQTARELNDEGEAAIARWVQKQIDLAKALPQNIQTQMSNALSGTDFNNFAELKQSYQSIIDYLTTDPNGPHLTPTDDGYSWVVYFETKIKDGETDIKRLRNRLLKNYNGSPDAKRRKNQEIDEWLAEQSDDFRDWALNTLVIPDGVFYSIEQLEEKYLEYLKTVQESIPGSTISEAVKQFNEQLKPQFDALATAYDQVFHNEKGFQAGLDSLDIAWFEGIRSAFGDIKEELGVTFDTTKIDEFFDALENGEEITEKLAHEAFDDLATAYFYSAEGLQNLNDETAKSIKQMMKEMGVTNAEEIVDNSLELQHTLEDIIDFNRGLEEEYQKIEDWGLDSYAQQIKDQTIQSVYGNVDMDKRTIIRWSDELKETFKNALASWDYDPEIGGIDTVFGGDDVFQLDGQEIEVAFTPIMVDQNGNNPVFLNRQTCLEYIQNIIEMADKAVEDSGQEWSQEAVFEKAIELDATGMYVQGEDGGREYVRGLIAGIGENAPDIGALMHFSGEEGAIQIQEKAIAEYDKVVERLAQDGKTIEEITQADIKVLIKEGVVTGATADQLQYYAAMKAAANGTLLNETPAITALRNLAIAAGMAESEIEVLNEVMAMFDKAAGLEAKGAYTAANEVRKAAEARQRQFTQLVQEKFDVKFKMDFEVDWPKATEGAGSAGKEAAEEVVDEYEEALKILDEMKSNDLLSDKQYLDQKLLLIKDMWAKGKMSAQDYFKRIHDWLREMLDLYNKVISDVTKILQKEIDKLEKERDERIKSLEEERDAELKAIDDETEAIEKKIKAKQKEIDELQKENEKRKEAIDLQKALYELERARNQRTLLRYQEGADGKGQLLYRPDEAQIRDANAAVEEKEYEKRVKVLENELELLEKSRDTLSEQREEIEKHYQELIDETNKYYDEAIKRIEEYKSHWESLLEAEEGALLETRLASLGLSMDDILSLDMGSFESFKEMYLGILNDIYGKNELMQDSLTGAWGDLPSYLETTGDAINGLNKIDLSSFESAMSSLNNGIQYLKDLDPESWPTPLTDVADDYTEVGDNAEIAGEKAVTGANNASSAYDGTKDSIDGVKDAIGTEGSNAESGSEGSTGDDSLIGRTNQLADTSDARIGSDEGMKGDFDDTSKSVDTVKKGVDELSKSLKEATAEPYVFTIDVQGKFSKIFSNGLFDFIGDMDLSIEGRSSAGNGHSSHKIGASEFNGTVGAAFFDGYPGLDSPEQNALRSEFGQPELTVYPDGTYEITTQPTFADLPKGTVIFNEEQTRRILNGSGKNGKAFANGSNPNIVPLSQAMPEKDEIFKRFEANLQENIKLMNSNIADMTMGVRDIAQSVTNITNNGNTGNNITNNISVTCPGVTEADVARNIGGALQKELDGMFTGFALRANQRAMRR